MAAGGACSFLTLIMETILFLVSDWKAQKKAEREAKAKEKSTLKGASGVGANKVVDSTPLADESTEPKKDR